MPRETLAVNSSWGSTFSSLTLAVLQRLRLDAQLATLDAGGVPDNLVQPASLRRLDRELLRDALRVVKAFQQHVRGVFHLGD